MEDSSRCNQRAHWLGAFFFILTFALLLVFFRGVDVYHRHFFATGGLIFSYQLARLVLAAYLGWMIYAVGYGLLYVCMRDALQQLRCGREEFLLCFFTGAGLWTVLMLVLGLAGAYSWGLAVMLSLTVVSISSRHFTLCMEALFRCLSRVCADRDLRPMLLAFALGAAFFVVVRGLFPGGGHDYYTHYFYYYRQVIDSGSVMPNAVWYQFFYSKGAGIYFLAMLLSDPLAPQIAALVFVLTAATLVFAFLARDFAETVWPWAGAALFLLLLIYTDTEALVTWGYLEKLHMPAAACALGMLWIYFRLREGLPPGIAWPALAGTTVGVVCLSLPLGVLMGVFFLWQLIRRQREAFFVLAMLGIAVTMIFAINWWVTGLLLEHLLVPLWNWLDFEKVGRVLGRGEVVEMRWAHNMVGDDPQSPLFMLLAYVPLFLRLNMLVPLLLLLVAIYAAITANGMLRTLRMQSPFPPALCFLGGFLLVFVVLAVIGGRSQSYSFHRFGVVTLAPVVIWLMLLLAWYGQHVYARMCRKPCPPAVLPLVVIALILGNAWPVERVASMGKQALQLMVGRISLYEAYAHPQGWPGKAWGGIYPGAQKAMEVAGPDVRIWSFHTSSFCMLPRCRMESFLSFRLSSDWETVIFGGAEEAQALLQQEGLNYFFFSRELPIMDILPLAPLFALQQIPQRFSVVWADGSSWLLTWKTPGLPSPDPAFLQFFSQKRDASPLVQRFNGTAMKALFEQTRIKSP